MEYKVVENLMKIKLNNFISEYRSASKLFENTDVRNNLLHPGEYGVYKENLVAKLFGYTLPQKYSCGTGFITNVNKEITTQCDIILYDKMNSPFLEIDEINRFFPQEAVYAIGEIKSTLTKQQLFDALLKMAQNKMIRNAFQGTTGRDEAVDVDPRRDAYQSICTFLICDEITGWTKDIAKEIQKMYEENEVDVQYRFNLLLSLKNGVLSYDIQNAILKIKEHGGKLDDSFEKNGGHFCFASPFFKGIRDEIIILDNYISEMKSELDNLKHFLVIFNNYLVHLESYYPDPVYYFYE